MPLFPGILQNQRRTTLRLIDEVETSLLPGKDFPSFLRFLFRKNKQFGSRDRRLYTELIYTWLRHREYIDPLRSTEAENAIDIIVALAEETPETKPHKESIDPELIQELSSAKKWKERKEILKAQIPKDHTLQSFCFFPDWMGVNSERLDEAIFFERAPLWIRARDKNSDIFSNLETEGFVISPSSYLSTAGKAKSSAKITQSRAYQEGKVEIQDIGSQLLLEMVCPASGETWFDACAGAGGKTLQLANFVGSTGTVWASDIRDEILTELKTRAKRAGYSNIHICRNREIQGSLPSEFDGILIDAPCSGSGTWRRRPYLRHQTTLQTATAYSKIQQKLLLEKSNKVKPGGRLIYTTCSLSERENEGTVSAFLQSHSEFILEPPQKCFGLTPDKEGTLTITPDDFNGDGFFIACFRRKK